MKACTTCNLTFPTSAAYWSHHHRVHRSQNPWRCEEVTCGKRFATRREMRTHSRTHVREREQRPNDEHSVERGTARETFERPLSTNDTQIERSNDDGEERDVEEIASNCAYFDKQLRTARSSAVTRWNTEDFENAHKWALYVQDETKNENNGMEVFRQLEERGINSKRMKSAQVLLFDSILGCDALKQTMLEPICKSIYEMKDDSSLRALTESVYTAMQRKSTLYSLQQACNSIGVPVDDTVMKDAAAKVLLEAHSGIDDIQKVEQHMKLLANTPDGIELLVRESILAHNNGDDADATSNIVAAAMNIIVKAYEEDKDVFLQIPGFIMSIACGVSFNLFNHYISYLLSHSHITSTNDDECEEARDRRSVIDERLRQLLLQRGNVGEISKLLIDRIS